MVIVPGPMHNNGVISVGRPVAFTNELCKLDKALEPGLDAIKIVDQTEGALEAAALIGVDLRSDVPQTPLQKPVRPCLPAR